MTTAETSTREGLLIVLSCLASVSEQREFAAEVRYDVYQDEMADWWFFDDLNPDFRRRIFSPSELEALAAFSKVLDRVGSRLDGKVLTMEQLHATVEWQRIVTSANEALDKIKSPPNQSPEPTAVSAVSPLSRAVASVRRWLSFFRYAPHRPRLGIRRPRKNRGCLVR